MKVEFKIYDEEGYLIDLKYITFEEMVTLSHQYVNEEIHFTSHEGKMPLFVMMKKQKVTPF